MSKSIDWNRIMEIDSNELTKMGLISLRNHIFAMAISRLKIEHPVYEYAERRLQDKVVPFYWELVKFIKRHGVITVRQFYYHCLSTPGLPNTQHNWNFYQRIDDYTTRARLMGLIPLWSIADDTDLEGIERWEINIEDYLKKKANDYRSEWFKDQDNYVEVWLEKRALSMIVAPIVNKYGIYLSVGGKYPSWSQINSYIHRIKGNGKSNIILYLGDLDPSGKHMVEFLKEGIRKLGGYAEIIEVALNPDQVENYNLLTLPLKRKDKRIEWFLAEYGDIEGCELDALDPDDLKKILVLAMEEHLDLEKLRIHKWLDVKSKWSIIKKLQSSEKKKSKEGS